MILMLRGSSLLKTLLRSTHTAWGAAMVLALSTVVIRPAHAQPMPPTNLTATALSSSSIRLDWVNHAAGANIAIQVERSLNGTTFSSIGGARCTAGGCPAMFTDNGLQPSTGYAYRIRACETVFPSRCSAYSNIARALTKPAAPTLQTPVVHLRSIKLTWTTSVLPPQFRVERSLDGTTFTILNTVPGNQLTYTDTVSALGTTYYYRVTAVQGTDTAPSNIVQAMTGSLTLSVGTIRLGSISLSWTAVAPDQYRVERSFDGFNFGTINTVAGNQTSYSDLTVVLGTTYFYRVTAVQGTDTAASNVVQAATESLVLRVDNVRLGSVRLSWTALAVDQYRVERWNGTSYVTIATLFPPQTSFTDGHLALATTYSYRITVVRGSDSGVSNGVSATTQAVVLRVADVCVRSVGLAWTPPAMDQYTVDRSTDGTNFTTIGTVPGVQSTFTDSGLDQGVYFYRVTAFAGDESAVSRVLRVTLGPVSINHATDFSDPSDLTANGNAQFTSNLARLTEAKFFQASTIFSNQRLDIRKFTTSFTIQLHDGSNPPADGMTFIIQRNSSTELGPYGGGLGYGPDFPGPARGIRNSVAVKFDIYSNAGEGTNSTGLFTDGRSPTVRETGLPDTFPDRSVDLTPTAIELKNANPKQVDLSYDGTTLTEKITDLVTTQSFTTAYTVDIPGIVGTETAYVGFGGGTGGLYMVQDVLHWTFNSDPSGLVPLAPIRLRVLGVPAQDQITTGWCDTDFFATGTIVEQSTDGVTFAEVSRVDTGVMTYTDMGLAAGAYSYRVRAFNDQGTSAPSNVDSVLIPAANIDHSAGFSTHDDLVNNGTAKFVDPLAQLTDGIGFAQAGSIFSKSRVGIGSFTTSFTFQLLPGTSPMADGITFTIQGNDPTALGPSGGGLGYGPDFPGPARGIRNSVAVKFDLYNNAGEGTNSTGLFTDGRSPTVRETGLPDSIPDISVDLTGTGVDLSRQNPLQVDMSYDGASLTVTITDTVTGDSATQAYTVDIPSFVGGRLAYVGWTGGTGGLTALQDVLSWTFQSSSVSP